MNDIDSDSAVKKWLDNYAVEGHRNRLSYLRDFLRYVHSKPEFKDATPLSLVEFQRAAGKDNQYKILDLLQGYINQKVGTHKTLTTRYSVVCSFFERNRAALPGESFRIKATRDPIKSKLSIDVIKNLVSAADLDLRAVYLTLFQGISDQERFREFNLKAGPALADHLKTKGVDEPFFFEYPGRKQSKGKLYFYSFIGRDALTAWKTYFERIRGWPKEGEAVVIDRNGKPLSKWAISIRHLRLLEKLNYIKREKGGGGATRHGYGLHEFRDVAITLLHLQAKKDGFDEDCAQFWMGHVTDRNGYNKFYQDREHVLNNYRIAEKYLNLISGTAGSDLEKTQEKMRQYETLIQQMSCKFEDTTRRLEEVEKRLMTKE